MIFRCASILDNFGVQVFLDDKVWKAGLYQQVLVDEAALYCKKAVVT